MGVMVYQHTCRGIIMLEMVYHHVCGEDHHVRIGDHHNGNGYHNNGNGSRPLGFYLGMTHI